MRAASRHPKPQKGDDPQLSSIAADIHDRASIDIAVAGGFGVVNAVSLYVERGTETFQAVHVAAAERLAEEARKAGVRAAGSDLRDRSRCSSHRHPTSGRVGREAGGAGGLPRASMVRPAVMFGRDDVFLNTLSSCCGLCPSIRCSAEGKRGCSRPMSRTSAKPWHGYSKGQSQAALTVECGGPRIYSYEELLKTIARAANVRRILVPMPFAAWRALAWAGGVACRVLPSPGTR